MKVECTDGIKLACDITDCESYPNEVWELSSGDLCTEHKEKLENDTRELAKSAFMDMGLPEDEAENMLEDMGM